MPASILVVEDEPAIRDLLAVNLRHGGYRPLQAADASSARRQIDEELPDLILLDWMLPDQSGTEFARRLRSEDRTRGLPIIMLTARSEEGDRLNGFDAGVDDYICKPFSPRELLARIKALLRRAAPDTSDEPIDVDGLRLEPQTFRASGDGQPLKLGPTEFKLLSYLMRNPDRVLSRAKVLDGVWGDHVFIEERTVDVHIRRLRLALQPSGHDRLIETVRGGGYRLLPKLPSEAGGAQLTPGMIFVRGIVFVLVALLAAGVLVQFGKPVTAVVWLAVCLAGVSVFHLYHLYRLNRWSVLPRQRQLPIGIGSWRSILDRLGRFTRQEAADREESNTELERLHAAVDLLPDALVVMDRYNLVQWFNRAAEELHGIVGLRRPIDHFIRQPEFTRYLESGDYRAPLTLSLPARPGRTFSLRLVPTPDSWRLLITRDITEQNKLDAMRRDFVANVSHEIRTPLTVVSGYIETLIDLDLPREESITHLAAARKQAVTMQRLLEDLLTLSSLENASNRPPDQEFELEPLLRSLLSDARTLSAGRHTIDLLIDKPVRLRGAPSEIESAVRNLLTNAIRYTPQGGRINMSWTLRARAGHLTVEDTGIGIAPEHLPRLTERFYRVDRGRSRETGGTGLGLAIVKHIAQRHDATLQFDSVLGKGTRFTLVIPLERALPSAGGTPQGETAAAGDDRRG